MFIFLDMDDQINVGSSSLKKHKLQVCENNWIRKIAGVRRVERRRMKDLREEVGTKACSSSCSSTVNLQINLTI